MSEEYKRAVQKNELLEKQIKHFAVADAKRLKDVWLVSEKEVKEQVERVLDLDSLICRRVLGLSWERPRTEFTERSGPVRPQGQSVSRLSHSEPESECSQRTMDICVRASEDRDFWERMSNIISEDKLKLWDDTEDALKQYHCVLTDVSALAALTETLQRENAELRRQLEALQDK
ncbi:dynein regulatory complex protein 1-like, partial [Plectropomus leopardus]|uniref:dynein regulatory complex protein 1-like n=1 Tax=Plectropomus leopardus TaxID=160734 RepID=UPI001C4AFCEF